MPKRKAISEKRTISLPAGLQKRMAKHPEVNWSGVAADAFEKKLNELSQRKEVKEMAGMIERLRASKEQSVSEFYTAGKTAGEEWARDTADFEELQRLEVRRAQLGDNWRDWLIPEERDEFGSGHRLAVAILGNERLLHHEAADFWDCAIGDDDEAQDQRNNDDFVRGFADSALEAFARVKRHL